MIQIHQTVTKMPMVDAAISIQKILVLNYILPFEIILDPIIYEQNFEI